MWVKGVTPLLIRPSDRLHVKVPCPGQWIMIFIFLMPMLWQIASEVGQTWNFLTDSVGVAIGRTKSSLRGSKIQLMAAHAYHLRCYWAVGWGVRRKLLSLSFERLSKPSKLFLQRLKHREVSSAPSHPQASSWLSLPPPTFRLCLCCPDFTPAI